MAMITLENVKVGMILAADVRTTQGMMVAKEGVVITEKHLKAFKAWGITEVDVGGEGAATGGAEAEAGGVVDEARLKETSERLDRLFCKTDRDDPIVSELHRLALAKALKSKT